MATGWIITWYVPLTSWMKISAGCNATWSQTVSVIILSRRKRQMDNTNVIWITLVMNMATNTQATSRRTKITCIGELRYKTFNCQVKDCRYHSRTFFSMSFSWGIFRLDFPTVRHQKWFCYIANYSTRSWKLSNRSASQSSCILTRQRAWDNAPIVVSLVCVHINLNNSTHFLNKYFWILPFAVTYVRYVVSSRSSRIWSERRRGG